MVISAAFIVPHGALILDALPSHKDGRYELHQAMVLVAKQIADLKPDLILVTSPHGISLSSDFGFYFNESAQGTAEWENEYQEYQVDVKIDLDFTKEVYDYLKATQQWVSMITAFSRSVPIPLRWGESVPLWFLRDIPNLKYVFLSQPQKRYELSSDFEKETISISKQITEFIHHHKKKVIVLISADLAHTHQKNGPYGYYEYAENVDLYFEQWMKSLGKTLISSEKREEIKKALCCGYTGFLMLHGMLLDSKFKRNVITRQIPTYYGMMVASFLPE